MAKPSFNSKRLLLVHAHPDDESLFTGHVIADAVARGAAVYLLTLTRGERGKMKLVDLKALEGKPAAMGAFRTNELFNAMNEFNSPSIEVQHTFAGTRAYLDSGMRISAFGKPTRKRLLDEMSLAAVSTSVVAEDILKVIKSFRPDAVVTYNRNGGFGHPDHKKAHEATVMALRLLNKERKGKGPQLWVIAEKGERSEVKVGNSETAKVKKAALEAHASQVGIGAETYWLVQGKETRYDEPERLRRASSSYWNTLKPLLKSVWALPVGVLIAVAGSMLHLIKAADSGAPIGLIVALLLVASVSLALRVLRRSRGALYLFAAAFWATLYYLIKTQESGGSQSFVGEISEWWKIGASVLIAGIMIFPRIQPAAWRRSADGHR
ncbi:MAG: PIG-L deacetylase family protein [Micrococcales bacterium]